MDGCAKERTNLGDIVQLLQSIQGNPSGTYKDLSNELNISESTVKRLVRKVKSLGVVIENTGSRKKPNYAITSWGYMAERAFSSPKESAGNERVVAVHELELDNGR